MKYFQFFTICALSFFPTPAEGIFLRLLLSNLYTRIFYTERRFKRDCDSLILSTGLDLTENPGGCSCRDFTDDGVDIVCSSLKDTICLSPSDSTFCTVSGNVYYTASTFDRSAFSFATSPLINDEYISAYFRAPDFSNTFDFFFFHGDGSPSSKKYTDCAIRSNVVVFSTEESSYIDCNSCAICDNGIDFKYDCSNAKGTYAFSDITNTTVLIPGPKVESCFPVADIVPTN